MAVKPTDGHLDWVTDDDPNKYISPSAAKKLQGWIAEEKPPFQYFNWAWRLIDRWIKWAEAQSDENVAAIGANTAHRGRTDNPHGVSKEQVGLSDVPNTDFTSAVAANTAHRTEAAPHPAQINPLTSLLRAIAGQVTSNWHTRSAVDKAWRSIAWSSSLGLFVAISQDTEHGDSILTSPDGINWTPSTGLDNDVAFRDIAWSPSLALFVAVGSVGIITTTQCAMRSSDGVNWTPCNTPYNYSWSSVVWSPELSLFVAVSDSGTGNRVMTSPDGITWTQRVTPADETWRCVAWSPELGLFAAVAATGTGSRVMTSQDGIAWTMRSTPDESWIGIAWSSALSMFAAVGGGGHVMTSQDGINWLSRDSGTTRNWRDIIYIEELSVFVAVAYDLSGDQVITSFDGINWALRSTPAANAWMALAWSPDLYMMAAVGQFGTGNRVMTAGLECGQME